VWCSYHQDDEGTDMKYHAFASMDYYPDGGMGDYQGSFNTIKAAKEICLCSMRSFGEGHSEIAIMKRGRLKTIYTTDYQGSRTVWKEESK